MLPMSWRSGSITAAAVALSLLTGWIAAVVIGGPVGVGAPRAEALVVGLATALATGWLMLRRPAHKRVATLRVVSLLSLPLVGVLGMMYASPDIAHTITATSEVGWLLAAGYVAALHLAPGAARQHRWAGDASYGGAVGTGCAVLVTTAISSGSFGWPTALIGWVAGAVILTGLVRLPPRPAIRLRRAAPLRVVPLGLAWVVALIVAVPAAPRHELATSAGGQALGAILAAGVLAAAALAWRAERRGPGVGVGRALRDQWQAVAPGAIGVALVGIGAFQAASYSAVTMDDLGRYWSIADSISNGIGYDVWQSGRLIAQGGAGGWLDLPVLPALMVAAFAVLGHTFPASLAPMFLANLALPGLLYLASRTLGAGRPVAFAVASLTVLAPTFQIYSLGAAEPDPLFAALLAAALWSFARVVLRPPSSRAWLALGLSVSLVALTRPEGPLYAGGLLLAAALARPGRKVALGLVAAAVPAAPFVWLSSLLVGRVWPQQPQDLSSANFASNVGTAVDTVWPWTVRVLLLNDPRAAILAGGVAALFALGAWALGRKRIALLVLPALAAIHLAVTLSISPIALRADQPPEFLRHIGPVAPVIAIVAGAGASYLSVAFGSRRRMRRLLYVMGTAATAYLVAGSLYLLATPEEFHHGNRSGSLLRADIYVNAPELWQHRLELPCPPCLAGQWDFLAFRHTLFETYAPFDAHSSSDGAAYQTITGVFVALGLAAAISRYRGSA